MAPVGLGFAAFNPCLRLALGPAIKHLAKVAPELAADITVKRTANGAAQGALAGRRLVVNFVLVVSGVVRKPDHLRSSLSVGHRPVADKPLWGRITGNASVYFGEAEASPDGVRRGQSGVRLPE